MIAAHIIIAPAPLHAIAGDVEVDRPYLELHSLAPFCTDGNVRSTNGNVPCFFNRS
jgi:hypothetical protein